MENFNHGRESETQGSSLLFDNLPAFPEGMVSNIYNAGPGLENDENSTVSSDSKMVVVSGVRDTVFNEYINTLNRTGYVCIFCYNNIVKSKQ